MGAFFRGAAALLACGFIVFFCRVANACAVCGAAERALPASGAEVPFAGRKRITIDGRAAAFETRDARLAVTEMRVEAAGSIAVATDTMVGADVPVLRRDVRGTNARVGIGDVELRATHTAWRNAGGQRFTLGGGLKLPTAPLEYDAAGVVVPPDLQPGCGAVMPFVAVTYAAMGTLFSAWTTLAFYLPAAVRDGPHPGASLRASGLLQVQPFDLLAARFGAHGRWDGRGDDGNEVIRTSGGGAAHASAEIVLAPGKDFVLSAGVAMPVVQEMRAYRATSPVAMLGVGLDF